MFVCRLQDLPDHVGADLGQRAWPAVDQHRIDVFAETTEDHQWIDMYPDRAEAGPFRGTIAHGHLSLSPTSRVSAEILAAQDALLRPARKGERPCPGQRFFKPLRQVIESVNYTFKGQLDPERHGGKTIAGVCARIAQRILALTAGFWNNDQLGLVVQRSLTACDH
jgi:hypothetical protein